MPMRKVVSAQRMRARKVKGSEETDEEAAREEEAETKKAS